MEKLTMFTGGTGVLMFLLGASAMDSKSITIPVIITVAGLVLVLFSIVGGEE